MISTDPDERETIADRRAAGETLIPNTRRVLITGGAGQLATELKKRLGDDGLVVSRGDCDITNETDVVAAIELHRPTAVINCAAYNAVDKAEDEPELAFRVNALGPRLLASVCQERAIHFTHVSTDYVFSGNPESPRPWVETDLVCPASAYGVSKRAGEEFVLASSPDHAVVRTCGLYSVSGSNFVKTMLRLAETRDVLRVVADQQCTPTFAGDLAEWLITISRHQASGLFHATNAGSTNWAEFAAVIFDVAGLGTAVEEITSAEYGAAATRPGYSVLDCSRLDAVLESPRRQWRDAVTEFVDAVR